jgi:hypothetical protein
MGRHRLEIPFMKMAISPLNLFYFQGPGAVDTPLDGLIGRAVLRIGGQGLFCVFPFSLRNFHLIPEPDFCDPQDPLDVFDVPLHLGDQDVFGLYTPHLQCGRQGAGQSPPDAGDHIIQGGGIFGTFDLTSILVLVKILDAPVDPEMDRLREISEMGRPMGPLVFLDANSTGVGD